MSAVSTSCEVWRPVAEAQAGIMTRRQLLELGLTRGQVAAEVRTGRWQIVRPGVWATFTGPLPPLTRVWAAVLDCGDGALVADETVLWLVGGPEAVAPHVEVVVSIPHGRKVAPKAGVRVVRRRHANAATVRPAHEPPRLSVEEAVVNVADRCGSAQRVVGVVMGVLQRRLTTTDRMRRALAARSRHRWRRLVEDVLAEVADGVQSPLERSYRTDVHLAHGLPAVQFNHREVDRAGRVRFRDARYAEYRVLVELDGREAHPLDRAHRDRWRDNAAALSGLVTPTCGAAHRGSSCADIASELPR